MSAPGRLVGRLVSLPAAVLVATLLQACGGGTPAAAPGILDGSAFVAVPRGDGAAVVAGVRSTALREVATPQLASGDSFYLAIRRSELSQRYFLSGYLKQMFPDGVLGGAASSMGTRVVSFRVQNDKLFLFDASDIYALSQAFDPTLVLEAWPLVHDSATFNHDPGRNGYLLIDPSAGLNRFNLVADTLFQPPQFKVGISYLQNFRRLPDGVAFDQVFTGEATDVIHGFDGGEYNLNRASGTLGVALRRYQEGPGFTIPPNPSQEYFFLSLPRSVPFTGGTVQTPVRWNIHRGMKPIRWTISPFVKVLAQDPFYGRYDLAGAIRRGVENWNAVFGFKAFEAVVGASDADPGDDVTNYIYADVNPSLGFAFADWRTNPNTGEIRGASVYWNTIWVDIGAQLFDPDALAARTVAPSPLAAAARARYRLGWAGMTPEPLCQFPVSPLLGEDLATVADLARRGVPSATARTGIQMVEDYVTGVVLHEIGHTLGLRHNFKGTLVPPSSSIMDYILDEDQVNVFVPQSWDIAAVKLLYDLSSSEPADPFCNDSGLRSDPECAAFDAGAAPLTDWWQPNYEVVLGRYLTGAWNFVPSGYVLNSLLGFVRAGGTGSVQQQAHDVAYGPVTGTAAPPAGLIGSRVNAWSGFLNRRLWVDSAAARASAANEIVNDPVVGPGTPLDTRFLAQQGGYLRNRNGVTSFANRRTTVDVLKKVQTSTAYLELLGAQADIQAASPPPVDPFVLDLLARIGVAVTPYYR